MSLDTIQFRELGTASRGSALGLPPDLLERSRGRIRVLAILILIAAGADLLLSLLSYAAGGFVLPAGRGGEAFLPAGADVVTILASSAMIALSRSRAITAARLLNVALFYEVALCALVSIANPFARLQSAGTLPGVTWVTPLIIFFPLIVPCPPRRTLLAAAASALCRPLGILVLASAGLTQAGAEDYLSASLDPAIAVVIAYFGSRAVYGLGLDVAKARRMGSYTLEQRIGRGGMGEVWQAKHSLLARPAAVKLIRPDFLGGMDLDARESALRRFEREAQSVSALRSPHTVQIYDFGVADGGSLYLVMELLEGMDLESFVDRYGAISPARTIHFLLQICHSLGEAHARELVHRDVKPANIFACRYGEDVDFIKVLDFGLVRDVQAGTPAGEALTARNVVHGTPAFMAPEQGMGAAGVDQRADVYAVGCVAFWLLTGRPVFEGNTAMELVVHHAKSAPAAPSELSEHDVPAALDALVLQCLEKDPMGRPQSMHLLAQALRDIRMEPPWTEERARRWWDRHRPGSEAAAPGMHTPTE